MALLPPVDWLPVNVQSVTVALARFNKPPPNESSPRLAADMLPLKVLFVTVRVAPSSLAIPPPLAASGVVESPLPPIAVLSSSTQVVTLRFPKLSMPPPCRARPFAIVKFSMVDATPEETVKTFWVPPPLTVSLLAPRPSTVRFTPIVSGPEVSVIVSPLRLLAKLIVSPLAAVVMAARSEPGPLSWLFMTVTVLSSVRSSIRSTRGKNCRRLESLTIAPSARQESRASHAAMPPIRGLEHRRLLLLQMRNDPRDPIA